MHTNCIAPILKIVNDKYEIVNGHLETVHLYTNDQNLLDNMHKNQDEEDRSNNIITTTGAGKAVTKNPISEGTYCKRCKSTNCQCFSSYIKLKIKKS